MDRVKGRGQFVEPYSQKASAKKKRVLDNKSKK
jgi:hypothetical protein